MLSLFRKKPPYPSESKWTVLRGHNNNTDKPMFVRRNDSAVQLKSHGDYSHRVGVAIPLLAPNDDGLPSNEEMDALDKIEDVLKPSFEDQQSSILALVITTSGMREFMFYTRSPGEIEAKLNSVRSRFPDHKLQSYVSADPQWAGYAQFASQETRA